LRVVDPKVVVGGEDAGVSGGTLELKRLTEISSVYAKILKDYTDAHPKHELSVRVDYKNE